MIFKVGDRVRLKKLKSYKGLDPDWLTKKYGQNCIFTIYEFCDCQNATHPGVREIRLKDMCYIGYSNEYELVDNTLSSFLDALKNNEENYYGKETEDIQDVERD